MKNAVKTKILFVLENYIDRHASIPLGPSRCEGHSKFGALFALENNIISLLKNIQPALGTFSHRDVKE